MIIKHCDAKNGTVYFSAEEIQMHTLILRKFSKKEDKNNDGDCGDCKCVEIESYDRYRSLDSYEDYCNQIKRLTGWRLYPIEFVTNSGLDYENFNENHCIAVLLKTEDINSRKVLVFDEMTYLMNDKGETVDKLI